MAIVERFDRGRVTGTTRTPQGYLRLDGYATRTGILEYRNPDGSIRRELRHPDEVTNADSLATLAGIPVTDTHPPAMLDAQNTRQYSRGHTGDTPTMDGDLVRVPITITDAGLIADVEANRKRELSCGYNCDLVMEPGEFNGERYDARQTNIVYNHLAAVPRGRAGSNVRLRMDAAEEHIPGDPGEGEPMPKINVDGVELEVADASTAVTINNKLRADAARIATLEGEVSTACKDATDAQAAIVPVQAKLDTATEQLAKRNDAPDPAPLVKARLDLMGKALKLLPVETKLDSLLEMSDRQLKEKAILAAFPAAKLDGQPDLYVDARFDAALESAPAERRDSTADLRGLLSPGTPVKAAERVDADSARAKMIEDNKNAWKQKEGK